MYLEVLQPIHPLYYECFTAKVSGVKEIIMVTPPRENGSIDPAILVAADISGSK